MDVDNRTADVAEKPLRLLVVEDSPQDAEIAVREIRRGGFDVTWKRVETAETLRAALDAEPWDAVVADYRMPNFDGLAALRVLQEKGLDIPFIIVSGTIGEETAVAAMKAGAHDYLMKDRLARLAPTIDRELRDAAVRREKRRLEEGMREAARQWRTTFDAMNDAVCLIDIDLRIVRCNRLFCNLVGKPWGKILGQTYYSIVHGCAAPIADCPVVRARESRHHESLLLEMKGRWWALAADPVLDDAGQLIGLVQVLADVTEQRAAEAALRKSEEKFRLLSESAIIGIYIIQDAKIAYANPHIAKLFGYSQEELTGNLTLMDAIHPEDKLTVMRKSQERLEGKTEKGGLFYRGIKKDGSIIYIEAYSVLVDYEGRQALMGTLIDVTERKQAEEKLRFFALAVESSSDAIGMSTPAGKHYYQNKAFDDLFGVVGENPPATLYVEEQAGREVFRTIMEGNPWSGEIKMRGKAGELLDVLLRAYAINDDTERILGLVGVHTDITERKRAEEALRESEELFRSYLESAPDGVYMNDMEGTFLYGNRKCEEIIGYRREELIGKNFLELNILPEKHLNLAVKLLQANMEGRSTGPDEIELISKEGRHTPVEINTSVVQRMGQRIVLSFARDITERKEAVEELQRTLERLKKAINTTIQVMISAVEVRDPYTAGHQLRSADLARTIATEMELPPNIIDGLRMAGSIHDIGKLSVPAEILSKPTKLTAIEFSLIKEHSRNGYEMLKDVESPWPLAEIVYQHHERMDGSGYPRNLKGDEILMEARIMAVADVVEAMASHRPYRPSLGLDAALQEIEKNRGTHYDNTVVDACLRLFREKVYQLEGA